MPIPKPREGQSKKDFVAACMADETMVQEYKQEQRYAVCNSQWERRTMNHVNNSLAHYTPQVRDLTGRPHMVVPCTLLVEGVHHGSSGPMFYSASSISRHAEEWNGRPVTIPHPTDGQGQPALCGSDPSVYSRHVVGQVFGATMQNTRLRAELWLDQARLRELDPALLDRIQRGEPVEVSTGLLPLATTENGGTWHNEEYVTEIVEMRQDHLAILPNVQGACSLNDGCGIHNRKEDVNVMTEKKIEEKTPPENEEKIENHISCENKKADGSDPVGNGGNEKMGDEQKKDEKPVVNADPKKESEKASDPAPAAPAPTPAPVVENKKELTLDEWMGQLPAPAREMVANGLGLLKTQKDELVTNIAKAKGNVYTVEELSAKPICDLRKISALLPVPEPSYVGNAGAPITDNTGKGITPLIMPTLESMFAPADKK